MRKTVSKILAAVMAAAVVVTMAPVDSQAAITAQKEVTFYATPNSLRSYSIYIDGAKNSSKLTDAKSSNTSVAKPVSVYRYSNEAISKESSNYNGMNLEYQIYKPGTATLSYKVDGKSLSTKVTALKYTNPLKSLKVAGGANVASKFNKSADVQVKRLGATKKNAKITATAAPGWKITNLQITMYKKNGTWYNSYASQSYNHYEGASSLTLAPGTLSKGQYTVSITARNTKTNGYVYLYYNMNK